MLRRNPPRWHYHINPTDAWFASFVRTFESPDIYIWDEAANDSQSDFIWTSPHLDDVATKQELVDRSAALKTIFDGAMYIVHGPLYNPLSLGVPVANNPVDLGLLSQLSEDGDVTTNPYSAKHIRHKYRHGQVPKPDHVALLLFLARHDKMTEDILKYTGVNKLGYITLYAFNDWMNAGGWGDKRIASEAGWSNKQHDDFGETANNPTFLGPFGRHGGVKAPPKRPMLLKDAHGPMRKALNSFLMERAKGLSLDVMWRSAYL